MKILSRSKGKVKMVKSKNMKTCHFWARRFMSLSQKYEERVRKISFHARRHFKAELLELHFKSKVIFISDQNYSGLY